MSFSFKCKWGVVIHVVSHFSLIEFHWFTHVNTNVIWGINLRFHKPRIKKRAFPYFSWHRKLYIYIIIFLYLVFLYLYIKYTSSIRQMCSNYTSIIIPLLFIPHGVHARCDYFKAQWLQIANLHWHNDTITKKLMKHEF